VPLHGCFIFPAAAAAAANNAVVAVAADVFAVVVRSLTVPSMSVVLK
jgi:hypothetical protein